MPSLELLDYWLDRLSIDGGDRPGTYRITAAGTALKSRATVDDTREPSVTWRVLRTLDPSQRRYRVKLKVAIPPSGGRKHGVIEVSGAFVLMAEAERPEAFLNLNAPSILYGIARGIVGSVTAATPAGKLVLPAIDFTTAEHQRAGGASPGSAPRRRPGR